MLQAIMTAPGAIEIKEKPIPVVGSDEVLIKMMRIGVCGSDIHVFYGKHPFTSYPVVQGHEVAGEIVDIGKDVVEFKVGDKVTIQPQVICGECYSCKNSNYHICDNLKVMGFQTTGMAAQYVAVNQDKVLKIAPNISFEYGAMVEPVAVAVHALHKSKSLVNKKVLVLGAGPIGNLVGQVAKGLGADKVMITDISDYRLQIAEQCKIDYCINPNKTDLMEALKTRFGPNKADLILECVGANVTIEQAINCARKGSDIIVVGVFAEKPTIDLGYVQDRELNLLGTLMYQREDYLTAIQLISDNKLILDPLISKHFSFQDYRQAYDYIEEQKDQIMKVIIDVN